MSFLQEKEKVVAHISNIASDAITSIVLDYRGITANEMNELRAMARKSGVDLQVVKNTLVRRALQNTSFNCLDEVFKGPTLITFSKHDPGAPARLIDNFVKDHPALVVKAISMGSKLLDAGKLKAVAELPTYEKALGLLMNVLKGPLVQLVRVLKEPYAQCVRVLTAVGQKKSVSN